MRGNPMRGPLIRGTLLLTLAAAMFTVSLPADAGGGHRHHHRARVGVTIGAPVLLAPLWVSPYPYYYYPAPVVVRERVIVREPLVFYDEQGRPVPPESRSAPAQPQAQAQQGAAAPIWYFCADSQTYYPYAQSCASAWQRVVPHPPPPR